MLVHQKLIKRFLAYRKYETQIAREKVVGFAIAFSLGVLNFLAQLFDKRYERNLWDRNV